MVLSNGFFYERIQLDTINERFNKVPTAKEGDANGRGMIVVLTENGLVKNTTGVSLLFKWEHTRIGGAQGLEDFEPLDLTKGEYIVTYPTEMNHEGYVKAEIRIIDNGKYAGSRNMKIQVEPSVGDDTAMESSNQFSALVTALLQVNSWNTTIDGKIVEWEDDMTATKQLYIDKMNEVDATYPIELNSVKQQLAEAATKDELSQVASPLVASLVAQMTDTTRVYVYTGAEGGYTSGNWYYHNGTAWVSGGLYQSSGIGTGAVTSTKLSDAAVTPLQTGFLAIGKNLFDKSTITSGYIINGVGALSATAGMFVSDFIPSAALTGYIKKYATGAITYYDSAGTRLSYQIPTATFTTPANTKYFRFNGLLSELDTEQVELGNVSTAYEAYGTKLKNMLPLSIPITAINIDTYSLKADAYPFQPLVTLKTNGGVDASAFIKKAIKKIELYGADTSKKYAINYIQKNYLTYGTGIVISECNSDGSYKADVATNVDTGHIIPTGLTTFDLYTTNNSGIRARIWIDWAEIPDNTQYVVRYYAQGGLDERVKIPVVALSLPSTINAVVGDTLEIFYKGILQTMNPLDYNIIVSASKGNAYKNRWIYTPQSGDGNFNLTISVTDAQNVKLVEKTTLIKVSTIKVSPSTAKNVLCVGDSLTQAGTWVRELDRRLTMTGGTPAGHGLTNINFIGSKLNEDTGYEGYGGWTWQSFNSNIVPLKYWVTVTSGMKTETISEQSVWSDGTNQWQLETIDAANSKLKFKQYPEGGSYAMWASGTLTFISGGGDTTNIVFSASEAESGNPFWNTATGQLDFTKYCSDRGYSGIDYCNILLGWNNTNLTGAQLVVEGKKFVDALKLAYPNVKVTLIGLQVPSIDGLGANYGSSASWNYYLKLLKVFEFNKAYEDWTKEVGYSTYMSFIHLSSQFDTDNNMPQATRTVNVRSSKTESYGTNGVHPEYEGYMQIADANYRALMSLL